MTSAHRRASLRSESSEPAPTAPMPPTDRRKPRGFAVALRAKLRIREDCCSPRRSNRNQSVEGGCGSAPAAAPPRWLRQSHPLLTAPRGRQSNHSTRAPQSMRLRHPWLRRLLPSALRARLRIVRRSIPAPLFRAITTAPFGSAPRAARYLLRRRYRYHHCDGRRLRVLREALKRRAPAAPAFSFWLCGGAFKRHAPRRPPP